MAAVRGIGGVELTADGVVMHPHMIGWWDSMQFSFCWHGQRIFATLTNESVELVSADTNSAAVPITIFGKAYVLEAGASICHSLEL